MSWDFPEISLDMFFKLTFGEIFISEQNTDWNCFNVQREAYRGNSPTVRGAKHSLNLNLKKKIEKILKLWKIMIFWEKRISGNKLPNHPRFTADKAPNAFKTIPKIILINSKKNPVKNENFEKSWKIIIFDHIFELQGESVAG